MAPTESPGRVARSREYSFESDCKRPFSLYLFSMSHLSAIGRPWRLWRKLHITRTSMGPRLRPLMRDALGISDSLKSYAFQMLLLRVLGLSGSGFDLRSTLRMVHQHCFPSHVNLLLFVFLDAQPQTVGSFPRALSCPDSIPV